MYQASSLRIGNFLQNEDHTVCTVTGLQKQPDGQIAISAACIPAGSKFSGYIEEFSPIILNQSFFAKAGFDISIDTSLPGQLGISKYGIIFNANFQLCTYYSGVSIVGQALKYVHQLQNLYYALTGNELEFQ